MLDRIPAWSSSIWTRGTAVPTAVDIVTTMIRKRAEEDGDDRGMPAWAFAAVMVGAFAVVAVCALIGGWVGLTGIVVTAVALIVFAAARM